MKVICNLFCKLKKIIFFFVFWSHLRNWPHPKFFKFFQLKSKTRINFRNSCKKSKKNTKNCHEDKKLKVAQALCAPFRGNRVKGAKPLNIYGNIKITYYSKVTYLSCILHESSWGNRWCCLFLKKSTLDVDFSKNNMDL